MERVYFVEKKTKDYFVLKCATYNFTEKEEKVSAFDKLFSANKGLIVGKYVHFENEIINKSNDSLFVEGTPVLLENDLTPKDIDEYDKEFELSIRAYKENDNDGIERWKAYLKSYENKMFAFRVI